MQGSLEARRNPRKCTVYRPARIERRGRSYLGIMKDCSAEGAGFVCPIQIDVGERVLVATGNDPLRSAHVVWRSSDHFGVRFLESVAPTPCSDLAYRSVRIPTHLPAQIYFHGTRKAANLINVSPRGIALECDVSVMPGVLFSLVVEGHTFDGVTTRWCANGLIGARLPLNVKLATLQNLLVATNEDTAENVRLESSF